MSDNIEVFPVAEGYRSTDQVVTTPILNITFTMEQAIDIGDILLHEMKIQSNDSKAFLKVLQDFVGKWENKNNRQVHTGDVHDDFSK